MTVLSTSYNMEVLIYFGVR